MSIEDDLVRIADQRIRLHDTTTSLTGTVVTRDTTGSGATVLLDGSTVPVPVKCMGHVFCQPGDRVTLSRHGSDWLIYGGFAGAGFGEASRTLTGLSGTTTTLTSSSFLDVPEFGTLAFSKAFDNTFVRMAMTFSAYTTVSSGTAAIAGVRLTPIAGAAGYTATDYPIVGQYWNPTNTHLSAHGHWRFLSIPAGTYTVSARWRRSGGSGGVIADTNDYWAVELDERVRASSPYL